MKLTLEQAKAISDRVNDQLSSWDIPITVRPNFVLMVSLVIRELRAESKNSQQQLTPTNKTED